MSWLFSQALVAEYSPGICSDGEPSAQLNVMPTPQPFWRNDKPMDCSRFSRFGLTLRLLTDTDGEAVLASFLAAFPARTSALPERETALTEPDQVSGFKWPGSFAKYSRSACTWKTRQCSLLGGLEEFSETWPRWGSMRDGECSAQPTAVPRISGSASGLLPTPVTIDSGSRFNRSASDGAALRPTLGDMARFDLWPTPMARANSLDGGSNSRNAAKERGTWLTPTASLGTKGGRITPRKGSEGGTLIEAVSARIRPTPTVKGNDNRKGLSLKSGDGLATAVKRWPTPTAQDAKNNGGGVAAREEHETTECGGGWPAEPAVGRVVDGMANRVDQLRALGNGQVPRVAATAWLLLNRRR